ncbi:hypothetical protein BGZ72_008451 [Mortierella alpina]|nr:hypothetical protein BGZ72_008451 [Mortierella alpina]
MSFAIGEVIASKNSKRPIGSVVVGNFGWEEFSRLPASLSLDIISDPRNPKLPLSYYVGALGMPGFTAYGSLLKIGEPKAGETIFVSAAAGAVGQIVVQMAKQFGLRVVGSELKFDAAFNYKRGDILESLRAAAPEGTDIYHDLVGGEALDAALEVIHDHGRVVAVGAISDYHRTTYGIKNLRKIIHKGVRIQGFRVPHMPSEFRTQFHKDVTAWLLNRDIVYKEAIIEGLENAPKALHDIFTGAHFGKSVIKLADL